MADLVVAVLLLAAAGTYAAGVRRAGGRGRLVTPGQIGCFAGAMVTLAVALLPPLAERADDGLVAHMVQHVLLLVVAAPLLALAAPLPTLLRALPGVPGATAWRRALRSHSRRWLAWVSATLVVSSAVMLAWHAPVLYEAALHHEVVHAFEHVSFLATATAFWWAVGLGAARPRGGAVAAVFVAALPGTALGAALTLAAKPWYPDYPSLADQQLAGVVMWGFAGLAYVLAAAVVFGMWLRSVERDTPARPISEREEVAA
ncbi:MAG TPA: cytochrome c oxidase assembly protein [Acidimicrobiales bacterium]|nr:cytochrome c oxidase assembly protein [Acidimicrobiales bacterium]